MVPYIVPILLLLASNAAMTFAWYGHLKAPHWPLWIAVFVSWGIAFFEYWLAVPANRMGSSVYSLAELKAIQECVSLLVFVIISAVFFGQMVTWTQAAGFALMGVGAFLVFKGVNV